MTSDHTYILESSLPWLALIFVLAIGLGCVRLMRGPTVPDRIVALDTVVAAVIGLIVIEIIRSGQAVYLRAIIVLSLVSFIGTIAVAGQLRKETRK